MWTSGVIVVKSEYCGFASIYGDCFISEVMTSTRISNLFAGLQRSSTCDRIFNRFQNMTRGCGCSFVLSSMQRPLSTQRPSVEESPVPQTSTTTRETIMNVFDRKCKLLQRERAAIQPDNNVYDYLKGEVGYRVADRVKDVSRKFEVALDIGCGKGNLNSVIPSTSSLQYSAGLNYLVYWKINIDHSRGRNNSSVTKYHNFRLCWVLLRTLLISTGLAITRFKSR